MRTRRDSADSNQGGTFKGSADLVGVLMQKRKMPWGGLVINTPGSFLIVFNRGDFGAGMFTGSGSGNRGHTRRLVRLLSSTRTFYVPNGKISYQVLLISNGL
jgi:hypothetical protein